MRERAIVIGGGISGLSAAATLRQAGWSVEVLEAGKRAGGNLRTQTHGAYRYEIGPHAFMPSADGMWRLVDLVAARDALAPASAAAAVRYVYRNGRLHALPMGPWSFMTTRLLSLRAKLRLCAEPFVRGAGTEDESAHAFFTRRLGPEAVTWLVGPFISGIYGGDPAQLGARDAFFKMWSWEREAGSMTLGARRYLKAKAEARKAHPPVTKTLTSFQGGLGTLVDRLEEPLGAGLHTGEAAESLAREGGDYVVKTARGTYRAPHLIVAVPPHEAADLLEPLGAEAAAWLREVRLAPMALVHLALRGEDATRVPQAFGFLVPRGQGLRLLGCLFPSRMFPDRAPDDEVLLACYIGGVLDPAALDLPETELIELARTELSGVFGRDLAPVFANVRKVRRAIPQLTPGHRTRMASLQTWADAQGGLALAGNYLTGVGVSEAVDSGLRAAERLVERHHD